MNIVVLLIVAGVWFFLNAEKVKKAGKNGRTNAGENRTPSEKVPSRTKSAAVQKARREMMKNTAQWREARRKQDDAEQLHSVRVDSCEGRLQNLKVLYEAGILDREEYMQRVAKTKARHAQGLMH